VKDTWLVAPPLPIVHWFGENMQVAQVSLDVLTLSDGVKMLHNRHDCGVSLHPDSDIFRRALDDL
jgi:hypothetical protein